MTNPLGIQLRSLRLRGPDRTEARIDFSPGLNVISGVSDTGKSYILKCIDFLFGASKKPKEIDEAAGYEQVFLEFADTEGAAFTVSRSLVNKTIRQYDVGIDAIQDPGESLGKDGGAGGKLSPFLLGKCGLEAVDIVKNARGESRRFSIRAIANWLCVDEETIIAERSPIRSTVTTDISYDANGFDYLITGHTSTVDEVKENPEITKAKLEAQQSLFDQLVASLDEQITHFANQAPNATVAGLDLHELEETLRSQSNALKQAHAELHRHHSQLRNVRAEHADIVIALERLRLLQSAYAADLSRLDFVLDGSHFFEQLRDVACPLCQRTGELPQEIAPLQEDALAVSCHAEKAMVARKSEELGQTVETLVEREQELASTLHGARSQIDSVEERINAELRPSLDNIQADIDQAIAAASVLARHNELTQRRDYLIEQKVALDSPSTQEKPERDSLVGIDSRAMQGVCDCIHGVLERWQFPDLGTVAFDSTTRVRDITIGGKKRSDYGKGYRAVTRAAFWVGVMEYCAKNTRAFPYLLILDSPLLNVKQHTEGENVKDEVKQAFFEDLSRLPEDRQVIVLENEEPPENVWQRCKFTLYKKDPETGLGGFLPTKEH